MPEFMNFHLAWNSPCRDAGNPLHDSGDVGLYDMDGEDRIVGGRVDVGADEVFACNGLSNADIYNEADRTGDGIVNYAEFSFFAAAWLSHDPNDPAWITDPNLIDEDLAEGWYEWKHVWNFDDTGDSAYTIDIADLGLFLDDWLWVACWKQNQMSRFEGQMMARGASVPLSSPAESSGYLISELNSIEKSTVQVLAILEQSVLEEPNQPNIEGVYEIIEFLQDCLTDIRSQKIID